MVSLDKNERKKLKDSVEEKIRYERIREKIID